MICLINRKRLLTFDPNPKKYKDLKIGDLLVTPRFKIPYLGVDTSIVTVTGFNRKSDTVYWSVSYKLDNSYRKMYGGILYSNIISCHSV